MRGMISAAVAVWLIAGQAVLAQEAVPPAASSAQPARTLVVLKRDTPIDLIATREINSAAVKPGDTFTLAVNTPVMVDGVLVVPFLAQATGQVTIADKAGGLGRNGAMAARLLHLQLGDARIPLSGEVSNAGGGGGSAALAVAFGGLLGLFHRGNNGKIKAGQRIAAFVGEDVHLDLSAVPVRAVEMKLVPVDAPAPAPAPAATPAPGA